MRAFAAERPPHRLWARVHLQGEDVVVCLGGGDRPHVGSVVCAEPRPSLADPSRRSATSSVWNRLGHKDEALARPMAEGLAAALGATVVVIAGVHVEGLDAAGIRAFEEMAAELTQEMARALAQPRSREEEDHG
ncbi:MAG: hypothetical protein H5T59_10990 [Anaerolineae bacterium]|nr:hypothetical protein [Anaerolineae bacterium]